MYDTRCYGECTNLFAHVVCHFLSPRENFRQRLDSPLSTRNNNNNVKQQKRFQPFNFFLYQANETVIALEMQYRQLQL